MKPFLKQRGGQQEPKKPKTNLLGSQNNQFAAWMMALAFAPWNLASPPESRVGNLDGRRTDPKGLNNNNPETILGCQLQYLVRAPYKYTQPGSLGSFVEVPLRWKDPKASKDPYAPANLQHDERRTTDRCCHVVSHTLES